MNKTTHRAITVTTVLAATLISLALSGCSGAGPAPTNSKSASTQSTIDACLSEDGNCLGVLEPGSYKSQNFNTFGAASVGQLAYKVGDDSWANELDHQGAYWFQRAKAYTAGIGDGHVADIYVYSDVAPALQEYPACPMASDPSGPSDASGLVNWISDLPGLTVTPIKDLQMGKLSAKGVDVVIDLNTASKCSGDGGDGVPFVPVISSRPVAPDPYMIGISEGEKVRIYSVDVGGGHTVGILIDAPTAEFDALVAPAQKLISTFTFTAP
jgi:hypothetical protein